MKSPSKPWVIGAHPEYTAFRLTVNVCLDAQGNVWSDHTFPSEQEEEIALGLPQGGVPQIAHALLSEAVRREVFQLLLFRLMQDPGLLDTWSLASDSLRQHMEEQVGRQVLTVLTSVLPKMLPGAVAGVLRMMMDTKHSSNV